MNINEQEARLIALVEEFRDLECHKLIENAQQKSLQVLKTEHQNARQRLHKAVVRERARAISLIRSAEAELHTRQRANKQRIAQSLLKQGWSNLEKALIQKWQQAEGRRSWIKNCAREALNRLPASDYWVVQHSYDTSTQDLTMFERLLSKQLTETSIKMEVNKEIEAGLIISSNKTCLDMSLSGMLHDRPGIEGRMLALLNKVGEA